MAACPELSRVAPDAAKLLPIAEAALKALAAEAQEARSQGEHVHAPVVHAQVTHHSHGHGHDALPHGHGHGHGHGHAVRGALEVLGHGKTHEALHRVDEALSPLHAAVRAALAAKRQACPRLHALGDSELLELLGGGIGGVEVRACCFDSIQYTVYRGFHSMQRVYTGRHGRSGYTDWARLAPRPRRTYQMQAHRHACQRSPTREPQVLLPPLMPRLFTAATGARLSRDQTEIVAVVTAGGEALELARPVRLCALQRRYSTVTAPLQGRYKAVVWPLHGRCMAVAWPLQVRLRASVEVWITSLEKEIAISVRHAAQQYITDHAEHPAAALDPANNPLLGAIRGCQPVTLAACELFWAQAGNGGCNRMERRLRPYVVEAATVCRRGCDRI